MKYFTAVKISILSLFIMLGSLILTIYRDKEVKNMQIINPVEAVPYVLTTGGQKLACKRLEIGAWNMDSTVSVLVAHGLGAAWDKIRMIQFIIFDDANTTMYPCTLRSGCTPTEMEVYIGAYNSVNIQLARKNTTFFDNAGFDDAVMNRGYILLWYEV